MFHVYFEQLILRKNTRRIGKEEDDEAVTFSSAGQALAKLCRLK